MSARGWSASREKVKEERGKRSPFPNACEVSPPSLKGVGGIKPGSTPYNWSMAKTTEPEYIVDRRGRKTKVILPVKEYETMLEDLYDLRRAAEVRGEESVS